MELGLFQKQTQKLVMTTELRQAITILQYSTLELSNFIKEQALENPLVELKDSTWEEKQTYEPSFTASEPSYDARPYEGDQTPSPFDFISHREDDLHTHLMQQVRFLKIKGQERKNLLYLVENVNDAGYLTVSFEEAAASLNVSLNDMERAHNRLMHFDPPGVGARTLKECLLFQLYHVAADNELAERIIIEDLTLLAEKKWKELSKKYDVTLQDIQAVADLVCSLDPKPGSSFGGDTPRYLVPDITVEKIEGEYVVSVNDYLLPKIQLNKQYQYMLTQTKKDEAASYMHDKYQKMMWLIKSIEQRRLTLLKITETIINKQKDFLEKGPLYLKPLTMKEIADEIDVHESTVSRATKHKVVQTPKGVYELKEFFTSKLSSETGDDASSSTVKLHIKELVNTENKQKPLSDQKIAQLLKEEKGLTVSRRTVAKYREEMNIPASSKRKRYR
ncbi:RNA polymerase factor sigma-54 [Bacillus taeanensis]|uniref:RNA polymerase sigma-54 factor n=1 Tax=Bacillus taeanensis TaxID=273032 RepID=A0A366Y470_9BACI|nr:RNA polymerase factor sigma-54 [Bacillus taeanensis]RBW71213.1 RNA polymerase sigma-54 factor [Bacillus taeanensis]